MDNTLWDFDKNSQEALSYLYQKYDMKEKLKVDFESFIETYERINLKLWKLYDVRLLSKEELRYKRFYETFLYFKYNCLNSAQQWANEYLQLSPYKTHLKEGARDILIYLKTKYQLHIITNGFKEVQQIKLKECRLASFFDQVIISEEHGFSKPDIKIFDLAQKLSLAKHHECVMIGDNYETDILGALNANWKAIYVSNIEQKNDNCNYYQINGLMNLQKMF